jgi:hypothetical protein
VYFNCFLAIASLDDARIWGQFLAYVFRGGSAGVDNRVPQAENSWVKSVWDWPLLVAGHAPEKCSGYAYWLFAQDGNVYDFTGRCVLLHVLGMQAQQTWSAAVPCRQLFWELLHTCIEHVVCWYAISCGFDALTYSRSHNCLLLLLPLLLPLLLLLLLLLLLPAA